MDKKIKELFESGMTGQEIAKQIGIGKTTVYRSLKRNGIVPNLLYRSGERLKKGTFTKTMLEKAASLYIKNKSLEATALIFGCTASGLSNAFRRIGIETFPVGSHPKEIGEEKTKQILEMWDKGLSQSGISRTVACSQTAVRRVLIKHGLELTNCRTRGEKSGRWKGGKILMNGYSYIQIPTENKFVSMLTSNGYVSEHRYVMAKHLNRILNKNETVHHKDGNKLNNSIENLQLRNGKHGKGCTFKCRDCGSLNIESIAMD